MRVFRIICPHVLVEITPLWVQKHIDTSQGSSITHSRYSIAIDIFHREGKFIQYALTQVPA